MFGVIDGVRSRANWLTTSYASNYTTITIVSPCQESNLRLTLIKRVL